MSNPFESSIKMKTAEQVSAMFRNKDQWTSEQFLIIEREIKKRGLSKFEEPEEWNEEVMEAMDLNLPKNQFERDLQAITDINSTAHNQKDVAVAAMIMSIASVISAGLGIMMVTSIYKIPFIFALIMAIISLTLHIIKQPLASVVCGAVSLLIIGVTMAVIVLKLV